jgi:hypothetical protein
MNFDRVQLRLVGTRAETGFRLSAKRRSPCDPAGATVQSTTGSREVCRSVVSICTVLERLRSAVLRGMVDTHSILLLPIHFPSHSSPCAMSF